MGGHQGVASPPPGLNGIPWLRKELEEQSPLVLGSSCDFSVYAPSQGHHHGQGAKAWGAELRDELVPHLARTGYSLNTF